MEDRPHEIGLGCMRLSRKGTDEEQAIAVVHAALQAGVRFLDTADVYAPTDDAIGHNERLIARALAIWPGDANEVTVATKGGLTRPGGRWRPDGRAKHLRAACEASLRALGVERIALYQLHTPDPGRFPTSIRALARLQAEGLIGEIGLCNVNLERLRAAREIVPIASVQVALSPLVDAPWRDGLATYCAKHGIRLIAHSPFGGPARHRRLAKDATLLAVAARHGASPYEVTLAWLRGRGALPIPGAGRIETARAIGRAAELRLAAEDGAALDEAFGPSAPRAKPTPPLQTDGEVVLIMGYPGAGKTSAAEPLVEAGYLRLNRDEAGGRLKDLIPRLNDALAAGRRRVVLDNTYPTRALRQRVIEVATQSGVPVRAVWLDTPLEEAQINAASRMLDVAGRLLDRDALRGRPEPNLFAPGAQFRYRRQLEPPTEDEGFARIERRPFARRPLGPEHCARALILKYDGVLRRSRSGARSPVDPDDVEIVPGRRERLAAYKSEGGLLLGLSWQPELSGGTLDEPTLAAIFERTHALLDLEIPYLVCPHPAGPPICWCRKPLPGLGLIFIREHRLDPARCLHVGTAAADETFARRLGIPYLSADEYFGASPPK